MDDLKTIWHFMNDFWKLVKQYYRTDQDPDAAYWHDLIMDGSALGEKYHGARLAVHLILGFCDFANEQCMKARGNQAEDHHKFEWRDATPEEVKIWRK